MLLGVFIFSTKDDLYTLQDSARARTMFICSLEFAVKKEKRKYSDDIKN